jgi:hypothetical protein
LNARDAASTASIAASRVRPASAWTVSTSLVHHPR